MPGDDRPLTANPSHEDHDSRGPEYGGAHAPGSAKARFPEELNTVQRRRLGATCKYIDGLLCDIEHALHSPQSESPFPHYVVDVTPAQVRVIEGHIRRLRTQLLKTLDWQHMKPEPPEIPVSRSVMTDLGFVEIAVEELRPRHMRGCGAVPEDAIDGLNEVVNELRSLLHNISHDIRDELGLARGSLPDEREGADKKA
jgi:hypothetical protein